MNPSRSPISLWASDFAALFLPRRCAGCDDGLMRFEECLCLHCAHDLPRTRFHDDPLNRVEQIFRGKVELTAASSFLHFSATGMVQRMLHRLKYHHDRQLGLYLGRLMAEDLMISPRFQGVDSFLPVPLHPRKEHMRGYNQSQVLVDGMRQCWPLPSIGKELLRVVRTPSQTRRSRLDRWLNVKEAFHLPDPVKLSGKHVLIVDDVVTTGATLEGCVKALSVVPDIRISLYTVACA
ncbi:MAG: ComF family protein [Flavobacteriales bacterium]|nr:ComF family protein [Flavobacteriales bacterium]